MGRGGALSGGMLGQRCINCSIFSERHLSDARKMGHGDIVLPIITVESILRMKTEMIL